MHSDQSTYSYLIVLGVNLFVEWINIFCNRRITLIHSDWIFYWVLNTKISLINGFLVQLPRALNALSCSSHIGLMACLTLIHLTNCLLLPHPRFSGFKHLKTLVLNELPVEKRLLSCLFSNCPHLDDLTFVDCQFNYAVNITSPTLHHLKLITSDLPWKIDIVTPNLSSFEYRGNILSISSISAPHLAKFSLAPCSPCEELQIPHAFALLASLPLLRSLSMFFSPSQVASLPKTIAPFQHLTEMELFFHGTQDENDDYLWVLDMVMACPRLQKLHFGIASPYLSANQRPRREHPGFSHSKLKCVELHGCVGHTSEIELAGHFLKYVNSLEHITFGPRARIYLGAGEWMDGFDRPCWFSAGRNMAREELQDNGRTRLVFV